MSAHAVQPGTPKNRADIRGQVKVFKNECRDAMANELRHAEDFILDVRDTRAWDEYVDYLTEDELRAAWKAACALVAGGQP